MRSATPLFFMVGLLCKSNFFTLKITKRVMNLKWGALLRIKRSAPQIAKRATSSLSSSLIFYNEFESEDKTVEQF